MKEAINKFKNTLEYNREKKEFLSNWVKTMTYTNTYNSMNHTFEIVEEVKTDYGWHFKLLCPYGLTYDKLAILKPTIEHNMKCHFEYIVTQSNTCAVCDIIYERLIVANKIPFEPVKVKPYEFYLGVKINGEPVIADINKNPFILIAGATRKGKNGALNHGLISLIHSCTKEQIRILYYQGAKGDGRIYKNCEQVYAWSMNNLYELLEMCMYCKKQMDERTKLFEPMYDKFKGDNILAYNKMNKHNQLPYIYLVIDEFIAVNIDKSDCSDTKEVKKAIMDILSKMAQFGGALGVTYVIAHQKPEKELCPTFLKNMSNTRVCFGFEDDICSRIVLGNDLAKNLPPRRAYVLTESKCALMFTTNLENRIRQYLEPHYKKHRRDLFEDNTKIQRFHHVAEIRKGNNVVNGKESIADEQANKDKEEEMNRKEIAYKEQKSLIQKYENTIKELQMKLNKLEKQSINSKEEDKYNYDMVTPPANPLEDNINKIEGFVEYQPLIQGKERIE